MHSGRLATMTADPYLGIHKNLACRRSASSTIRISCLVLNETPNRPSEYLVLRPPRRQRLHLIIFDSILRQQGVVGIRACLNSDALQHQRPRNLTVGLHASPLPPRQQITTAIVNPRYVRTARIGTLMQEPRCRCFRQLGHRHGR